MDKLYNVEFSISKQKFSDSRNFTFSTYEKAEECFDKFISKIKESKYFENGTIDCNDNICKYYSWRYTTKSGDFCLATVNITEHVPSLKDFDDSLNIDKFIECKDVHDYF